MDVWLAADECGPADVKSCGPGIPTLMPSRSGEDPSGDGGQKARCTEEITYKR
jgi:hypothetical protein